MNIVLCHIVGICVVDGSTAIFIRPLHKERGILLLFFLPGKSAMPEACGLPKELLHLRRYRFPCNFSIAMDGIRHIGSYVRFTEPDIPTFALLQTVSGTHPWEACAGKILFLGESFCIFQSIQAILR